MSPTEFWWEFDMKAQAQKQTQPAAGGFSAAEWEAARKKHREKMNGR